MLTIKEAAHRAGLSPDVLRAWERRYGVVRPTRTPTGYRLYSEADIGRLRAMQGLIEEGFRPREAAEYLAHDPTAGTGHAGRADGAGRPPRSRGPASAATAWDDAGVAAVAYRSRLIAAAASLDVAELSACFDELGTRGTFEVACEDVLFPAFRSLGEAWSEGTVSVAGEHAVSAAALRWLGAQYQAAAQDGRRPQVLVALPPGAHHELGALAHAVALRRSGLDVLYLGPDLPADDLVDAVRTTGASVVVLGAVMARDARAAQRVAAALEAASSGARLAFGGAHASALAQNGTVLPEGFNAAVVAVRGLLPGRAGRGR